ncbi:MAG: hypothetical protein ACRC8K_04550 [Waterburya sp.]
MLKLIKNTASIITITCLLGNCLSLPVLAKKNPCLKNNNGIGNNHDIFVELPTNSQSLNDPDNQILSIRIDPGNRGQMSKFQDGLAEQGFNTGEIKFVVDQVWDAEIRVKANNLSCPLDSQVEQDYTLFAD